MAIDKALEDQIKVPKTVYDEEFNRAAFMDREGGSSKFVGS